MSKKTTAGRMEAPGKKRRILIIAVTAFIAAVILGTAGVNRIVRMNRVEISTALIPGDFKEAVDTLLGEAKKTDPRLRILDPASKESQGADIIIRPYEGGNVRENLFLFDPYVLLTDTRIGMNVKTSFSELNLRSFLQELSKYAYPTRPSLLVAGNYDAAFAAFILYLSHELLSPEDFAIVLNSFEADDGRVPAQMEPVITYCRRLAEEGILARNWTNWDDLGLKHSIEDGTAVFIFAPRSFLKKLSHEQAFFLTTLRPPAGEGKRRYSLFGRGLEVSPGKGPVRDAARDLLKALKSPDLQLAVESGTPFSPMGPSRSFLNGEHRDAESWLKYAEDLVDVALPSGNRELIRELRMKLIY